MEYLERLNIPPERWRFCSPPPSIHDIRPYFSPPFSSRERRLFSPPPSSHEVCIYPNKKPRLSSPPPVEIAAARDAPFTVPDVCLDTGTLFRRQEYLPTEFLSAWEGPETGVVFTVDPRNAKIMFSFSYTEASDVQVGRSRKGKRVVYKEIKLEFLVRDIIEFKHYQSPPDLWHVILLRLSSSPFLSQRSNKQFWSRIVDFTPNGAFGRSDFYMISIPQDCGIELNLAIEYLTQQRVQEVCIHWPLNIVEEPETEDAHPFFYIHHHEICFEVMFLVNAVMHKGIFTRFQLTKSFFLLLRRESKEVNMAALNYIYSHGPSTMFDGTVFDACKRLRDVQLWFMANPNLLGNVPQSDDNIALVRRLVITPTKAYCLPPEAELPNRVLRRFEHVGDQFLRVKFTDEGMETIFSSVMNSYGNPSVYSRIKTILSEGFKLCGRKYSFLCFSQNQLRDRSAWFFAECNKYKVYHIRNWMGKFTNRNVAKYSARQGLCFSSTYATVEVPSSKVNFHLPDIERNGYNFSDGIGKISPYLAMRVAEKLNLESDPPCAYQIRYAGCKGVIACWPIKGEKTQLSLRPSMNKFESQHKILEVCCWTRFQPAFLNRQIITLLSTLGVRDEVFWDMQQQMVSKLKQMFVDTDAAFDVVTSCCGEQGNNAAIMLSAGFEPQREPHLRGILTCIQASQLKGLREKSRIFVPSGRWLMGCLDELGVLEQGQCFIQVSNPSIQKCFREHGSRFDQVEKSLRVIKGKVVVAKNPCLHPGDVRILEAVDAPGLHHLHDCLIFPQKGHRPHSNEASGSDLDGDIYFVTWDKNLIPPSMKSWEAMEFDTVQPILLDRPVTTYDIVDFFVKNMTNENLGAICNAHVVRSDISEYGASDEDCLELAKLAATAVDLPKTGKIVTVPSYLKPKVFPDFMGKEDFKSYRSDKILGRLFRQITGVSDEDVTASCDPGCVPYDIDMVVQGYEKFIDEAREKKRSYDFQLKGLMKQYKVKNEEEIVTGHVWSMPKTQKPGELQDHLNNSYRALKKEFRQCFQKMLRGFESLTDDDRNNYYERKASAWYVATYFPEESLIMQGPDGPGDRGMLSFAWIATDYLARIKVKNHRVRTIDSGMPINSLRRYIADRI